MTQAPEQVLRRREHVVPAGVEAVDEDDLVGGGGPGNAGLQVRQVPPVPELHPGAVTGGPPGAPQILGGGGLIARWYTSRSNEASRSTSAVLSIPADECLF